MVGPGAAGVLAEFLTVAGLREALRAVALQDWGGWEMTAAGVLLEALRRSEGWQAWKAERGQQACLHPQGLSRRDLWFRSTTEFPVDGHGLNRRLGRRTSPSWGFGKAGRQGRQPWVGCACCGTCARHCMSGLHEARVIAMSLTCDMPTSKHRLSLANMSEHQQGGRTCCCADWAAETAVLIAVAFELAVADVVLAEAAAHQTHGD